MKKIERHGMSDTKEYWIWVQMIRRCNYEKHPEYKRYGARGVSVCERWLNSFAAFFEDMGKKPEGLSLDRIDYHGNYCKENCRWADAIEQSNNTRRNHFMIVDGIYTTLTQHARRRKIVPVTIYRRLKAGCSQQEAFDIKDLAKWRATNGK